jgi:hypothetical protein
LAIQKYAEFIAEGKKKLTNAGSIMKTDNIAGTQTAINFSDETLENLRRKLYDIFMKDINSDSSKSEIINKAVSTYVYALDKKLRIDSDILDRLAQEVGMTNKEVVDIISNETDEFYGGANNVYGRTS